ncbi:hypothetical protein [Enterovibrio norvegicus]|uniref:hypothetical protein n=1 Tax=Enterovibrio norvegicus TaxID=188144 RepID=UPI000C8510F3|nr:hypothetical protein [Enterovibrio norvegicus]PMH64450.1 hypothetical protein BCU62_15460 [Enterovibrio norvegicus]
MMNHMFDNHVISETQVKRPRRSQSRGPKVVIPDNQEMMMTLYPDDYSTHEHLEKLMKTEIILWCEDDVRQLQKLTMANVAKILSRANSSKSAVNECLIWVFSEDQENDFSLYQCSALLERDSTFLQMKYVSILANTVRELRKDEADSKKIDFYKKCLIRAKQLIGDEEFVTLTPAEAAATYL